MYEMYLYFLIVKVRGNIGIALITSLKEISEWLKTKYLYYHFQSFFSANHRKLLRSAAPDCSFRILFHVVSNYLGFFF